MSQTSNQLTITRICNACVLIEISGHTILTDPFFWNPPYMGIDEPIAIEPKDLPTLSAIIGGHSVPDHWQIGTLMDYPYKDTVPVFVATKSMARKARSVGFEKVEVVEWGEHRTISEHLNLEVVTAQKSAGFTVNNYVLRGQGISVFVGSEARDLEPLKEYRRNNDKVNVAISPVNAVHLFGLFKLVMSGKEAVEATKILGAKTFFAIHDSHRNRPFLISTKSSGDDAVAAARGNSEVEVIQMPVGKPWTFEPKIQPTSRQLIQVEMIQVENKST